ncbi:transmembrane channel-like protein 7 isoform X2 [Thalassophryne amazonica]|uniref:transmembrane channel-like protein 7 isoform X2 n=1 Tax=Thalassophryne amazonica TaxID=390379 RepID=UPI00147113D6|nr:transmembrane channel-like protein 7 isoform X2 [Thalassophryne amazonica]
MEMKIQPDETRCSSQSSDSCEYYQTEIFDQLPSIQASRQDQISTADNDLSHAHLSRRPRDLRESSEPLRNLAMCLQAKRDVRKRRNMQIKKFGFWESWRQSESIHRKRLWEQMRVFLSDLLLWQRTLHSIEGRFGVGVKSYFVLLRYLICVNLLHCLLICVSIVGPAVLHGRSDSWDLLRFGDGDSVLDFFLGTVRTCDSSVCCQCQCVLTISVLQGYLDRSPVFFGFFTRGSLNLPCLNSPLLYLSGIFTVFFLSLIMVIRRTTVGYKHTWMLEKRYSMNVSFRIFCGWDFTIQDPTAAGLKYSFIRNDLKLLLEEQSFSLREAQRTFSQRVRLHLVRFVLNLLILTLLGGAFCLIYFSTQTSQAAAQQSGNHWLVSLVLQYLPAITMMLVNLFLPHVFRKISSFEDYSFTTQVNATLVRSIFLKLASLGIYLLFLFQTKWHQCWENCFGREMYKLCIFNFLASFCNTFLFNYPRKLLWNRYPESLVARLLGKQHFLIPFNVLDLVHSQTVSWVGVYYCPLLPMIGTVTLVLTVYIKKFTVLHCCVAEQRMFRASSSSVLFHFMLLLGLVLAGTSLAFSLGQFSPSSSCGPFGSGETIFSVTGACVDSLPGPAHTVIRYMASEAFALPLLLAEIIILTSYVTQRRSNQRTIQSLKGMLVMLRQTFPGAKTFQHPQTSGKKSKRNQQH